MTAPEAPTVTPSLARKPLDEEIDVYGLTHPGKVRKVIRTISCSRRCAGGWRSSSRVCPSEPTAAQGRPPGVPRNDRGRASAAARRGQWRAGMALEQVTQYVTQSVQCYHGATRGRPRSSSRCSRRRCRPTRRAGTPLWIPDLQAWHDPDRVDRGVALGVRAPGRRSPLLRVPCGWVSCSGSRAIRRWRRSWLIWAC